MNLQLLRAKIHKLQHQGLIGIKALPFYTVVIVNIMWTIKEMSEVMVDCVSGIPRNADMGTHTGAHKRHTFVLHHCFLCCGLSTGFRLKTQAAGH